MLSKYLTSGNVDELVAAATHKSKAQIEELIAERFPQPDLPELLQALGPPPPTRTTAASHGDEHSPENAVADPPPAPGPTQQHSPENAESRAPRPALKPLAPQRFGFHCTFDQETHDLFQDVRALMSHEVPTGEMVLVLKGALKLAKAQLEKRKFAATDRPGRSRPVTSRRYIPAAVKRAVRERDGERCAFVSDSGKRCTARTMLETIWNDGLAVVRSCHLREERPTSVARGHARSRVSASGARAA
jgi:hypothetical protein